jgi:hypothetical protein
MDKLLDLSCVLFNVIGLHKFSKRIYEIRFARALKEQDKGLVEDAWF